VADRPHPYAPHEPVTRGSLYRRILNKTDYFVPDEGGPSGHDGRPSGFVFLPDSGEEYTSMFLTDCVDQKAMLRECPEKCPGCGLCEVSVTDLIELGARVTYEPEWGFGHTGVWGLDSTKPGGKLRRKIAFRAIVHLRPQMYRW